MINSWKGTNSLYDCGNLPAKSMGKFSNAITLLHRAHTKVKDNADDIQVICGGLDAFLDFEKIQASSCQYQL